MRNITITKQVPVIGEYDVVVCGGGPAGFFAAVCAAREGAKTALIEQHGFLGGMATAGLVTPLSVFTYNNELIIGGTPWEFIKRLEEMNGAYIEKPLGNVAFDPELYKLCMQRMALEAGVMLYMHSYLTDCICQEGYIRQVVIQNKNGAEAIEGKVFIDGTGDGDLAYLAGVPMQPREAVSLQPLSTNFILSGVDTSSELIGTAMHHNRQGVNCHCLPVREKLLELSAKKKMPDFGGPWFCTVLQDGCIAVNTTRANADACDNRDYCHAECQLREDVYSITEMLREHFVEFKHCRVAVTAPQAGIRETRHILGVHTITAEEYLNAYHYEDSVSRGAHPIDIHAAEGTCQTLHFLKKAAYVPYRALIAEKFPNLLVAGRCISADRQSFASLRVQASCMGTGQAAGVAAAQCSLANTNVQGLDLPVLIKKLKTLGAAL